MTHCKLPHVTNMCSMMIDYSGHKVMMCKGMTEIECVYMSSYFAVKQIETMHLRSGRQPF